MTLAVRAHLQAILFGSTSWLGKMVPASGSGLIKPTIATLPD